MRSKSTLRSGVGVGILLATISPLGAQDAKARRDQPLAEAPRSLSGLLARELDAVGGRLRSPGKEETVYVGELTDSVGRKYAVQVLHQISGAVQIAPTGADKDKKAPLKFDGSLPQGVSDRTDESLLETFVMDTFEGMVYSVRDGGAVYLMGRGFGAHPRTDKDHSGPRFDIYEVVAPVRTRQDRQLRLKRYYFDSATGLLQSTRYLDPTVSPVMNVETRFSNWIQVEGSTYPGLIERFENDSRVFSINTSAVASRSKQSTANSAE